MDTILKLKCTRRFRDKYNNIVGYNLVDSSNNTYNVSAKQLKLAIKQNKVRVTNLSLTSNDKLVLTGKFEKQDTAKTSSDVSSIPSLALFCSYRY